MKYVLAIFLLVSFLFCFTACEKNPPVESGVSSVTSSEESVSEPSLVESAEPSNVKPGIESSEAENTASDTENSSLSSTEEVTSEFLQNSLKKFHDSIDGLRAENIEEIRVWAVNPGGNQEERSTNPEQIQKWLKMFRSIKIGQVEPNKSLLGGTSVVFDVDDKQGNHVSFSVSNGGILLTDLQTQMVVEEMDGDLLVDLMEEMGFPPSLIIKEY